MRRNQKLFIKIIGVGTILFFISQAFWEITRHKTYWLYADNHQTLWQKVLDMAHIWWYSLSRESILFLGFTIAGIIFFLLSIIMED